jgi:hypothetical protein
MAPSLSFRNVIFRRDWYKFGYVTVEGYEAVAMEMYWPSIGT